MYLFAINGRARSQPIREDVTYVTSSLIGRYLAQPFIEPRTAMQCTLNCIMWSINYYYYYVEICILSYQVLSILSICIPLYPIAVVVDIRFSDHCSCWLGTMPNCLFEINILHKPLSINNLKNPDICQKSRNIGVIFIHDVIARKVWRYLDGERNAWWSRLNRGPYLPGSPPYLHVP